MPTINEIVQALLKCFQSQRIKQGFYVPHKSTFNPEVNRLLALKPMSPTQFKRVLLLTMDLLDSLEKS